MFIIMTILTIKVIHSFLVVVVVMIRVSLFSRGSRRFSPGSGVLVAGFSTMVLGAFGPLALGFR